jgi:SRSO17 transposase
LLLPVERKSVEPMAAAIAPDRVSSKHQSMNHFVSAASWSDEAVLGVVKGYALPVLRSRGEELALLVDDTGNVKRGTHSVGVARQYCGNVGKQENCQVAVTLSLANAAGSLPLAHQLYLPEEWAEDADRRKTAGVPEQIEFRTKPQIALEQIRLALKAGVPRGPVLADAGYGNGTDFRDTVTEEFKLPYVVGIESSTTVWPPGQEPLPPAPRKGGRGRPPTLLKRDATHKPVSVKGLALSLSPSAFKKVTWREGSAGKMKSRFAAVRVRPAHRDENRSEPRPEEWLLIEWPSDEAKPTKYWLSTLPATTSLKKLVNKAKLRWRIERDYQELKGELGLDHYEGRGWRGFHHHASLCIASYAFLMVERLSFSPSGTSPSQFQLQAPAVPEGFRPRGSPDPS